MNPQHNERPPQNAGGRDMWLRVSDVAIDHTYQRPLNELQVARMAAAWNPDLAGAIEVSHRADGRYVALDGQQRLVAARRAGVEFIRAIVHDHLTIQQEAARFVELNTLRARPKAIDIFNGRLASQEEEALAVRAVIEEAGCKVPRHSGETPYPGIMAVDACVRVYRATGRQGLLSTLQVLTACWPTDPKGLRGMMIYGVGATLWYYAGHPNFSVVALKDRLSRVPASRIIQRGMELATGGEGGPGTAKFGYPGHRLAVGEVYNRGARKTIPYLTLADARAVDAGHNPWVAEAKV
jgi:hypothetical protein